MSEEYHTNQPPQQRRRKQFPPAQEGYRYCFDCEQEKPLDQFRMHNGKPFSYCHDCVRNRNKAKTRSYKRERQYHARKPIALIYTREGYKVCPRCEKELLLEMFPLRKGKHTGACWDCERARDRERGRHRRITKKEKSYSEPLFERKPDTRATKQCSMCNQEKFLHADFGKLKSSPDGHYAECKTCREERKNSHPPVQQSLFFKVCPDCNIEKSLETDFRKGTKGRGYNRRCFQCESERATRYNAGRREEIRQYNQSRKNDPNFVEEHRKRARRRYHTNPRAVEYAKEQGRAWRKANPLKHREAGSRYDARKNGNKVGRVSYKRILERDGYWCYLCKSAINPAIKKGPYSLSFDHVTPLSPRPGEPQGTHSEDNIRPTHLRCNASKQNKPFHLYIPFDQVD